MEIEEVEIEGGCLREGEYRKVGDVGGKTCRELGPGPSETFSFPIGYPGQHSRRMSKQQASSFEQATEQGHGQIRSGEHEQGKSQRITGGNAVRHQQQY